MFKFRNAVIFLFLLAMVIPMGQSIGEKVVVIGLDGASHELMEGCMEEGDYPNIQEMTEKGDFKPMDAPLPPLTPVAMSSFLEGKNPGGTGIYSFEKRTPFEYDTTVVNSRDINEILPQRVEGKSVMINVPMTYPVPRTDGVVVSGFPGSTRGQYAYPPTVKKKLEDMNYSVTTAGTFEDRENLEKEVFDTFEKRREISLEFMDDYEWNFFMVMFTGDARLQHFSSPEECGGSVADYYSELDKFVGEVREKTDEDTTVVLMSNHGFEELDKKIYLYTFLKENGYLTPKKPNYYKHWLQDKAGDLMSFLGREDTGEISGRGEFSSTYMDEVNWDKTKAYTGSFYNGQIFLNMEGREPNGVVAEEDYEEVRQNIVDDLKELKDPETGERVFENVYVKEDIYSGSEMEKVPDIVVESPGYNHIARFGFGETFLRDPVEKSAPVKSGFVISDRRIEKKNLSIIDLSTSVAAELGTEFGEGDDIFEK